VIVTAGAFAAGFGAAGFGATCPEPAEGALGAGAPAVGGLGAGGGGALGAACPELAEGALALGGGGDALGGPPAPDGGDFIGGSGDFGGRFDDSDIISLSLSALPAASAILNKRLSSRLCLDRVGFAHIYKVGSEHRHRDRITRVFAVPRNRAQ